MKKKRPQCGLILENARGEILLQLRDTNPSIPYPDCWGTFGGEIEEGESPVQAIVREIQEELGYRLEEPEHYAVFRFDGYDIYMFRKKDPTISLEQLVVTEGQRGAFFSRERTPGLRYAFNCRMIVEDYFSRMK